MCRVVVEMCGVWTGPFAGKPAPTLNLRHTEIKCGSGLAREGADSVYTDKRNAKAAKVTTKTGTVNTTPTLK
jgi:hypothetical protein